MTEPPATIITPPAPTADPDVPCSPYTRPDEFIDRARELPMPDGMERALAEFCTDTTHGGALHLKDVPVDPVIPDTPVNRQPSTKQTFVSESVLAWCGTRLGEQVGYRQEKYGALFHQVTATAGEEFEQSSEGSGVPLKLHTERCFHPFLPDYVLFYALRNEPGTGAATTWASIRHVYPQLSKELREILFQPLYRTGIDYSFGNVNTVKANGPVLPVLSGDPRDPDMRYDEDLMTGLTPEAGDALREFTAILLRNLQETMLEAGECLILDNNKTVHGRGVHAPDYSGHDRWLQRVYVVRDFSASAADRPGGGRVIATEF